MGRIKGTENKVKLSESGRPFTSTLPIEERLKILANLVIDRILEDQQYGKLQIKPIPPTKYEK